MVLTFNEERFWKRRKSKKEVINSFIVASWSTDHLCFSSNHHCVLPCPILTVVVISTCRKVKGRRLPPSCISSIHILCGDQASHSAHITMLASLEQVTQGVARGQGDGLLRGQGPPGSSGWHWGEESDHIAVLTGDYWLASSTALVGLCSAPLPGHPWHTLGTTLQLLLTL